MVGPEGARARLARPVVVVLAVVAAAILWFTKDGAGSWADASRLATIESIVERGTLAIDDSRYFWQGDKLRFGEHYFSHQPPMLALIGALPYALLHHVFGLGIDHPWTYRGLTWVLVGAPVVAGLWALARLLAGAGLSARWTAVLVLLAGAGTLLFPYALVLNQHATAGGLVLIALLAVERARYVAAGALLAVATAIDLSAVFLAAACALPVLLSGGAIGVVRYGLGALPPLALHFAANHAITGDLKPPGLHFEAFRYPLSPFLLASLTGGAGEDLPGTQVVYAREALIGQSGLFSFHPWLALCVIAGLALPFARAPRTPFARGLLSATAAGALGTLVYYLTQSRNLGGSAFGIRWFCVFAPALALFAGAWIALRERDGAPWRPPRAATALFALVGVLSIAGAAFGAINPWAKFSWTWESSPLGMTHGEGRKPPTRWDHIVGEFRRIRQREPITREVYELRYQVLIDQHRRWYLQPTPWMTRAERDAFVRRGLERLEDVARVLDEVSSTSDARPYAHFWIGKFHAELGDVDAARRSYETTLRLRSQYVPAQRALEQLANGTRVGD